MKPTVMTDRKLQSRIAVRVRNANVILLIIVLTLVIITTAIMGTDISGRASEDLAYFYSVETVDKFNLYVSQDLAFVRKVACSSAVTEWFADENNPTKRADAYKEMMDYISLLNSGELYFGIDASKNEYAIHEGAMPEDFIPFDILDPDETYDDWYFDLINSDNEFAFNIDIDKVSNEWRIWINYKVITNGQITGVFCSGFQVDALLQNIFSRYNEDSVKGYIINRYGYIQLDSVLDQSSSQVRNGHILAENADASFKAFISSYLNNMDHYFSQEAQPEVIKTSSGIYRYASAAPIANSDWLVVTFFNSNALFSPNSLIALLCALILAFVLYMMISAYMMRRIVLNPLNCLTASLAETNEGNTKVIGNDREDEIGKLARTIEESWSRINEASERAKLMLDATPLGCTLFDAGLNCIDCNIEMLKLLELEDKYAYITRFFGYSPEYQPDGQPSLTKGRLMLIEAFEKGKSSAEWIHQTPSGVQIPTEVTLVRMSRGNGFIVAGFTQDLREQRQMIRDIKQRDVLFAAVNKAITLLLQAEVDEFEYALWNSMGIMANAVEADRVRLWRNYEVNDALYCTQLYEWSEGAKPSQGTEITIGVPYDEDLPGWKDMLIRGQCINSLVRNMSHQEQSRLASQGILSILIVPVFLRNEFWGFVGFNDCHQERLFTANEESILRSGSLLIANALLRNEMTQELAATLDKARSASQAKTRFLSNMSHEIRTPINAIVGMTMIGKYAHDGDKKDYAFEKIEIASSHLLGVINDILDISKIEANKFELSKVVFDFEKMLQKVINVIVFRVNEKSQKLTMSLDPQIPKILFGDDQRLAQVITNLLSNAVKFTPEQGIVSLRLVLLNVEDDICTLKVEVSDTGAGISPEQQTRLFTSFEQAESSTSRKFGGTGLGLAISKQIVELMDGKIWIESALGEGATFIFTINMTRIPDEINSSTAVCNYSNIKLLAVDDDPEALEYIALITRRMGAVCDTALNGNEALVHLQKNETYDICFVDWKMPGMDGLQLSHAIRAAGSEKPVIIMVSAYDWITIEQDALAAGINGFLSKPLFPSDLTECIEKYIGEKTNDLQEGHLSNPNNSFSGYRILLAEDVDINREIVQALLEPTELEIDCAVNGAQAVRMFSATPERYDMIFMDIQMPEMDGLTATRHIRATGIAKAKEIPIVAMTANVFREDVEGCMAAGMNDHIGKPINLDELMGKLRSYLPRKSIHS